jgi:hypothetical protein
MKKRIPFVIQGDFSKEFLERSHIQGNCVSKVRIGLYHQEELVSLMTFGGLRKNLGNISEEGSYELLRFCNKLNMTVIGGANKLFKYFREEYLPIEVISYADRSWSYNGESNLYARLGFDYVKTTDPNYFYVNKGKRENRFLYRKSELIKEGYDKDETEHEIMLERKIYRIYNSGNLKYCYRYK